MVTGGPGKKILVRQPNFRPHKKMRSMMRNLDEQLSDSSLSREEVTDALSNLTKADLIRLKSLSHLHARGLYKVEAADLVSEASARILAGTRKWPRGLSVVPFVSEVMRSIASQYKEEQKADVNVTLECDLLSAEQEARNILDNATKDDRYTSNPERIFDATAQLSQIQNIFNDDEQALAVILGRADGMSPAEAQAEFCMTTREYDSATKRVRRAFLRHELVRPQS